MQKIWDPIGSRILAAKGYSSVATASATVQASLGYMDGDKAKRSTLGAPVELVMRKRGVPSGIKLDC